MNRAVDSPVSCPYRRRMKRKDPTAGLSSDKIRRFQETIWGNFRRHGRDLPWRRTRDPYRILVSEIMLQQTQVQRVMLKYAEFIAAFPDFASLARARLRDVLCTWQGLGYNRRAIALKEIAERVVRDFNGALPDSIDTLATLPGIGRATASAICAFAFDRPVVFIETNIRTVFIYFLFQGRQRITDADIASLVEKTLPRRNHRQWYYALMDYGVMLKKHVPGLNKRSAHYQTQSPFQGSNRQMRGQVLKALIGGPKTPAALSKMLAPDPAHIRNILTRLESEGFIKKDRGLYAVV